MNELVTIKDTEISEVFVPGGLRPYIDKIKKEIGSLAFDINTDKGRKGIASAAAKVSRSKTYLDTVGKDYVALIKAKTKIIDNERKSMRDELDVFKDEVRKPLTEWEDKEKKRVSDIHTRIAKFSTCFMDLEDSSDSYKNMIDHLNAIEIDNSFDEFKGYAEQEKDKAITLLKAKYIVIKQDEKEAAEKAKLAVERAAKEQKERDERIAANAKKEAEQEAEQIRLEALERAEKEKKDAQDEADRKVREAEERGRLAVEAERKAAEKAENDRIAKEKSEIEAAEKKAANKAHRKAINNEVLVCLTSNLDIDDDQGKAIIEVIAKGLINHVTINY